MGRVYLIEHCIYEHNRKQERKAYQIYVTDRLKSINESLANAFGGQVAQMRYIELLEKVMNNEHQEERTAEEIISSISDKLEGLSNESI